mmetsp:Transcript_10914/g.26762  ORF Transcript_10914/g.26762 Transcript_10914/m.26762 type:complete len:260 (+) Transcript_10914:860-1639(+)
MARHPERQGLEPPPPRGRVQRPGGPRLPPRPHPPEPRARARRGVPLPPLPLHRALRREEGGAGEGLEEAAESPDESIPQEEVLRAHCKEREREGELAGRCRHLPPRMGVKGSVGSGGQRHRPEGLARHHRRTAEPSPRKGPDDLPPNRAAPAAGDRAPPVLLPPAVPRRAPRAPPPPAPQGPEDVLVPPVLRPPLPDPDQHLALLHRHGADARPGAQRPPGGGGRPARRPLALPLRPRRQDPRVRARHEAALPREPKRI